MASYLTIGVLLVAPIVNLEATAINYFNARSFYNTNSIEIDSPLNPVSVSGDNYLRRVRYFYQETTPITPPIIELELSGSAYFRVAKYYDPAIRGIGIGAIRQMIYNATDGTDEIIFAEFFPGRPTLISPLDRAFIHTENPTLLWTGLSLADYYEIQIARDIEFTVRVQTLNSFLTSTGFNSRLGDRYFWRVRGRNSFANSEWSVVWSFASTIPELIYLVRNLLIEQFKYRV